MRGLMMDIPLLITTIMRHALANHPRREIVSATSEGYLHRYDYAAAFARAAQLANALADLGVRHGDRVATLAWNDHRHFEAYYAVSCNGGVLHTVNPRLFADQVAYILHHGGAGIVLVDPRFVGLLEQLQPDLPNVRCCVVLTDDASMPETSLAGAISYEALIAGYPETCDWPALDENTACAICYTSGTTGDPKGVVYSHRSTVLHAMAVSMPNAMGISSADTVMPIVPMFHVNAWGMPYIAALAGTKLVLPGGRVGDRAALFDLITGETVTHSLAVPTVWRGFLDWLAQAEQTVPGLKKVVVGGAACPPGVIAEFRDAHGVDVQHSWGMTEMSPVGTCNTYTPAAGQSPEDVMRTRLKQGQSVFGVEMKITDEAGRELPRDGRATGRLKVRGPWVCSAYYGTGTDTSSHDADGWLDTGDVASIDASGYMQITDRTKDLIKSGGEWISSIILENIAQEHPAVAEAAAVAVPHPKWSERPLLVVVLKKGCSLDRRTLRAWYRGRVASWWIPDDLVVIDELPHTPTGKIQKSVLRERYAGHRLPDGGGRD